MSFLSGLSLFSFCFYVEPKLPACWLTFRRCTIRVLVLDFIYLLLSPFLVVTHERHWDGLIYVPLLTVSYIQGANLYRIFEYVATTGQLRVIAFRQWWVALRRAFVSATTRASRLVAFSWIQSFISNCQRKAKLRRPHRYAYACVRVSAFSSAFYTEFLVRGCS